MNPIDWTNALKGEVLAALVAVLGLLVLFGVDLTTEQIGGIMTAAGALAAVFIRLTTKMSPTRIPDGSVGAHPANVTDGSVVKVPPATSGPTGPAVVEGGALKPF